MPEVRERQGSISFEELQTHWQDGLIARCEYVVRAMELAGTEDIDRMIAEAPDKLGPSLREAFTEFKDGEWHWFSSSGHRYRYPDAAVAAILKWQFSSA